MKNKIYKFCLYYLFHLEHFLIKYHEQSTFLIIDCSEILTNYFLIYHNANMGGGGGICINIYFFYHMENVEHNNWSGKCGNGAKRSEIRNQGIEAPKIWNQGIEAQKIWNQGIEAQKIWNLGYGYP